MLSPLRISCSVNLPLPADFSLQPLLQNERLAALGNHQMFYPAVLAVTLLGLLQNLIPWSEELVAVEWILYSFDLLALTCFLFILLTQLDRRLLKLLFRSFEYGFLLTELLLQQVSLSVLNHAPDAVVSTCITSLAGLFIISLDALVGAGRRGKGAFLLAALLAYSYTLVWTHLNASSISDIQVSVFFYRTTVNSLLGSATLTLIAFVSKYLFYNLFRPGRMLILSSNILYSLKRDPLLGDGEELMMHAAELNATLIGVVVEQ
jgi:hypothetical protein